jgi:polyferredoxin
MPECAALPTDPAAAPPAETPVTGWRNPYKFLPKLRLLVQGAYILFFVIVGVEFHGFYRQAVSGGPVTAHRPPAVEGFLPISALMGLKRFILTGNYDEVHPAGLTILIAAILSSFLARKVFCSWVCPVGGISRALEWVGKKTLWKRSKRVTVVNDGVDLALTSLKYLLLAFFFWAIVIGMDKVAIYKFMNSTYNHAADAKMLLFFTEISRTAAITLIVLAALSVVIKHFWCRYLCPYGALMGWAAKFSPARIRRSPDLCIDCTKCARACPSQVKVDKLITIGSVECTGCLECTAACPAEGALFVSVPRGRVLPVWAMAAGTALLFFGIVGYAQWAGHWHTNVPSGVYQDLIPRAHDFAHP